MVTAVILLVMSWLLEDAGYEKTSTAFVVLFVCQVIYVVIKALFMLAKIADKP